jgi:hypothetical protein
MPIQFNLQSPSLAKEYQQFTDAQALDPQFRAGLKTELEAKLAPKQAQLALSRIDAFVEQGNDAISSKYTHRIPTQGQHNLELTFKFKSEGRFEEQAPKFIPAKLAPKEKHDLVGALDALGPAPSSEKASVNRFDTSGYEPGRGDRADFIDTVVSDALQFVGDHTNASTDHLEPDLREIAGAWFDANTSATKQKTRDLTATSGRHKRQTVLGKHQLCIEIYAFLGKNVEGKSDKAEFKRIAEHERTQMKASESHHMV